MTENKQDTINVDLPIEAEGEYVRVKGFCRLTREHWRDIASKPNYSGSSAIAFAPAVVAWIERDEWELLDVPEAGRRIQATLRDGRVETFEVRAIEDDSTWAYVWKDNPRGEIRYIQRVRDANGTGPTDIIAWEYVDEPAVDLAAIADKIAAAVKDLREAIR